MTASMLPMLFSNLLGQVPMIAVCIVGLVMLAGRRTSAPQAVAFAMGGFGLLAAVSFVIPFVSTVLLMVQMQGDVVLGSLSWIFFGLRVVSSLLHTAGIALLLVALLKALRTPAPATSP